MHGNSDVHPVLPSTDLASTRDAIHATVNLGGFWLTSEVSDGQEEWRRERQVATSSAPSPAPAAALAIGAPACSVGPTLTLAS